MAADSEGYIDIRGDGRVVLYKRQHLKNPKWQARISVPNATGYRVVSTKLFDLEEAKRFALNLYDDLRIQVMAGGQLNTRTFKLVYDEWKAYVKVHGRTRRDGSWDTTIERIDSYALEFFGGKRIDQIKEADFTEYWAWRRENYAKKVPSNSTLKRERTSIMPVFKFALSKGYITKVPETNTPKAKDGRRPTFTLEEWKAIRQAMPDWVKEAVELATWRDRFMAQHCIMFLANTGLRIGELRKFRWRDISSVEGQKDGEVGRYYVGHADGKTGVRQFVFQGGAEVSLKRVYEQRCRELSRGHPNDEIVKPDANEPVFCHPDGSPIREFKQSLKSLLKFAGVPVEVDGKARTIYSLRHFYATRRLSKEASAHLIAKQMGTSIEMLEKHYSHVINSKVAAQITGQKPSPIVMNGKVEFPF